MTNISNKISSILLVDDNASLNMVNIRYIERLEVAQQVAEVRNGQDAIDFLLKQNKYANGNPTFFPDVIILDLNMPIMDGFEFLEKYKEIVSDFQQSRIIVLSSTSRQDEKEKALGFEAVEDYWVKPITKEQWLALKEASKE